MTCPCPGPDHRHRAGLPAVQHRAAVHPELRRPGRPGGAPARRRRSRCSPGSGPRASTSTSAPSSTSATCGRSQQLHATFGLPGLHAAAGVNSTNDVNVHSIAIQVPVSTLTRSGHPDHRGVDHGQPPAGPAWDADNGQNVDSGPFRQVSRLGNPLVNEVLIPLGDKDQWNSLPPSDDKRFERYVTHPGLSALLPTLYPGVFPNLAAWSRRASRGPTWRPSCSPASPPGSSPGSPTSTGRCWPTCCG